MNAMPYAGPVQLVTIGLGPGEYLLESIRAAIADSRIENGAVVSGIGTLKSCRMHYVEHTGFPPRDRFFTLEKPLELLSLSGLIADREPHLHVAVSSGEEETHGGHLEDGSEVLYLAEIGILVFSDHRMVRRADPATTIKRLELKGSGGTGEPAGIRKASQRGQ
jgi:predicted DNA-binding protein with PD1-like motif